MISACCFWLLAAADRGGSTASGADPQGLGTDDTCNATPALGEAHAENQMQLYNNARQGYFNLSTRENTFGH